MDLFNNLKLHYEDRVAYHRFSCRTTSAKTPSSQGCQTSTNTIIEGQILASSGLSSYHIFFQTFLTFSWRLKALSEGTRRTLTSCPDNKSKQRHKGQAKAQDSSKNIDLCFFFLPVPHEHFTVFYVYYLNFFTILN